MKAVTQTLLATTMLFMVSGRCLSDEPPPPAPSLGSPPVQATENPSSSLNVVPPLQFGTPEDLSAVAARPSGGPPPADAGNAAGEQNGMPLPPPPAPGITSDDNNLKELKLPPAESDSTQPKEAEKEQAAPEKAASNDSIRNKKARKGKKRHRKKHSHRVAKEDNGPLPISYAIKDKLPEEIYKKSYDKYNRHLPIAYYEKDYDALLFTAARNDDINGLRSLMRQGRNINMFNAEGDTPLLIAVKSGSVNAVHLLRLHNAELNVTDASGMTPMEIATQSADQLMIRALDAE